MRNYPVGWGSCDRNAGKDKAVENADESVEFGDDSVHAGKKNRNCVISCCTFTHNLLTTIVSLFINSSPPSAAYISVSELG